MLELDSIELIGFKSFADRTRVTFADRITAVVGPNGCGKSNLADAIAWVLGTHTARNLRGQVMDDVIFNGTGRRKASGVAEVRLRLKRTGEKPLLIDGIEVTEEFLEVGRKLYRSGESQFLINDRRCRLMDIHRILDEAGLGFASYAIIAQGKIESFLTAKPLDRRNLIEEAAQISGYKSRRRSAELKLEMAQQNLLRINDIIGEVDRQLRSLKRQAAKARRYRRLKDEFREIQRVRFAIEADLQWRRIGEREALLKATRENEEGVLRELEGQETEYRSFQEAREVEENELAGLRKQRSEQLLELERTRNSLQFGAQQIEAIRKMLAANGQEQCSLEESVRVADQELAQLEIERDELGTSELAVRKTLSEWRQAAERYSNELQGVENRLEADRGELLRLSALIASARNLREQLEQTTNSSFHTGERLEAERARHSGRVEELSASLVQAGNRAEAMQQRLARLRESSEKERSRRTALEENCGELGDSVAELKNRMVAVQERIQSLQEVEMTRSHYSASVQKVLRQLSRSETVQARGTLADSIETSPLFEHLVEEFLENELEYIMVDSLDEAVKGLSEIKSWKGGKCTFFSIHSSNGFGKTGNGHRKKAAPEKGEGVYGRLIELLQMEPEVQAAFHRVMPAHAEAVVVSDIGRAMQLAHSFPESTFITLEGEALTPRGLLSASSTESRQLGLLSLKRRRQDLEKKVGEHQKQLAAAESLLESKRAELAESVRTLQLELAALHDLEKEAIGLARDRSEQAADLEREQRTVDLIAGELARLEQEQAECRDRIRRVEMELEATTRQRAEVDRRLLGGQQELRRLRSEQETAVAELNSVISDSRVLEERRGSLERTLVRVRDQKQGLERRLRDARESQVRDEARLQELEESLSSLEAKVEVLTAETESLSQLLHEREEAFQQARQKSHDLEAALDECRSRKSQLQEQRSRLEVEWARLDTQLKNLEAQSQEQFRIDLADVVAGIDLTSVDAAEAMERHERLRAELDAFGPINMTALEEYQENDERYRFLSQQRHDIETAIADATRAIQEINRRSRQQFNEAFQAINLNFREIFQKLFGGGECGMQLLDDDDVLESGIDIFAQPPGKKLQNIMLLSGGEKALTVFALLVAIFMYRPSQFCVLDEVDAPLDDANVRRFGSLVSELCSRTQFVVVTHNKRTMEMAGSLYGITMEEAGVSKVISARLDTQDRAEAAIA